MSSFIPEQETIAKAFSIAGLALAPLSTYFFRAHSLTLDYLQLFMMFAVTFGAPTTTTDYFSLRVGWSGIDFMKSFTDLFSQSTDFLYLYGFLISPGIAWFGAVILMLIILGIVKCVKKKQYFQGFYNFWKGVYRWFMPVLAYFASGQLMTNLANSKMDVDLYSSGGVSAFIILWMFIEVIGHKCAQNPEENIWKKWCEFFSSFRIISVMALMQVSLIHSDMAKYFIFGSIVIFDIVYLIKYKFTFRVLERVFFIIQEGVLITIFALFIFNTGYIKDYSLDILGLALVLLLEILLFIPKLVSHCKNGEEEEDPQVNPEGDRSPQLKKNNSFNNNLAPEPSRDNLKDSSDNSPRRSPPKRK